MQEETQMKPLSAPLLEAGKTSMTNQTERAVDQSPPPPKNTKASPEFVDKITKLLFTLSLTQKRYGIHADDIPAMGKAYAWALKEYDYGPIYRATQRLIKKKGDFPTPADIIQNITENPEHIALPPLSGWRYRISQEIGYIPAKAWFEKCEWDGETLTAPNQFFYNFITQNYETCLDKVFGKWLIKIA